MIVIATILADRKRYSQLEAIKAASQLKSEVPLRYYINIETGYTQEDFNREYYQLLSYLKDECPIPYDLDLWAWQSSWRQAPEWDQDQRRLAGIVTARNMCREYMLSTDATHILFVDSDVIVMADGLQKLLSLDHPLVGGLVPGRGAHSGSWYVFGEYDKKTKTRYPPVPVEKHAEAIEVVHGTMGYSLIQRDLISTLSFRAGPSREDMSTWMSEDPCFASDAYLNGFERWWLHTGVKAGHYDDPDNPLTAGAGR